MPEIDASTSLIALAVVAALLALAWERRRRAR
ncbi:MAG: VPEID-CTERM sorting domain-containing protein [Gemmobacter sp.]